MNLIDVQNLSKEFLLAKREKGFLNALRSFWSPQYISKQALHELSFCVKKGELIGFIGQNGAGKSTAIKILSGILVPTSGQVRVFDKTPWKERTEVVKRIGVVFGQKTQLWWDLPVYESFNLLKAIYKVEEEKYKSRISQLIEILELEDIVKVPVRLLSLGQRMRAEIAASLLHSPEILFLDEPTIGLDAACKLALRDFIKTLNKEQETTIVLTTHDMDDIEALCSRVLVIDKGSLYFDGSLQKLRSRISPERRLVIDLLHADENIAVKLARLVAVEGHRVTFHFNPEEVTATDLIAEITAKHSITDLYIENLPIAEIIAKFYKRAV